MDIRKAILFRFSVMYAITLGFAFWIILNVILIQASPKWGEKGLRMEVKEVPIKARRGDICAADGSPMATSVPYYELRMDLEAPGVKEVFHRDIDSLAICLSRLLRDKSPGAYRAALTRAYNTKQRYYQVSPKKVSYMDLEKVKQFPIFRRGRNKGGLIPHQENKRVYPFGTMAIRTLGKLNKGVGDGEDGGAGAFGIEQAFEEELRGVDGLALQQNLSGRWLVISTDDPKDGYNVETTLDVKIQDQTMYSLRNMIERTRAEYGTAIVMEVETGDIKAIANFGRNSSGKLIDGYQNYALGNAGCSEPGSTFKLVSMMAAMDDGKIDTSTIVDTGNGLWNYKKQWVRDSDYDKTGGHGKILARKAFELSSNVGVAKLITQAYTGHEKRFVERIRDFGFDEIPEIGLKGMGEPYIKSPGDKFWSGVTLAWMSFGYELKITPLQTLMFYNAVANDGKMMKPRLITAITENGRTLESFGNEVLHRSICSGSTLDKVHVMLEGVVENGTAKNIKSKAYKIAGKTGTAQVANRKDGYNHKGQKVYQSSFVGYFPAENPQYSCIVVINGPKGGNYYGGSVAGPVFRQIADYVYAYELGLREEFEPAKKKVEPDYPGMVAGRKKDLTRVLDELDIRDGWVFNKSEWVEAKNDDDDGLALTNREIKPGILPNVKGMGATDAVYLLENMGLRVSTRGAGKVRAQSLRAGDHFRKGQHIVLTLG